jgi:hypothetical protein
MAKFTPTTLNSGFSSTESLNTNFAELERLSDTWLSRDGTGPNSMQADIDMAGYNLLNVNILDADRIIGTPSDNAAEAAAASAAEAALSAFNASESEEAAAISENNANQAALSAAGSAQQAETFASVGLNASSAYDFGSVADDVILFPTDYGLITDPVA